MPGVSSDVEAIWCRFGWLEQLTAMMGIILGAVSMAFRWCWTDC